MSKFTTTVKKETISFDIPGTSNQDRGKNWEINDTSIYVICDGHGSYGDLFAEYSIDFLYENLSLIDFSIDDLTNIMNDIILKLEISSKEKFNRLHGGTTISIVIQRDEDIWILNLGDSDIVLFDNILEKYEILTEDHNCSNVEEFKRIINEKDNVLFYYDQLKYNFETIDLLYENSGGEWKKKTIPVANIYIKNVEGEYATYLGNGSDYKIAMTRSIGDFVYKDNYGLSHTPYIKRISKLRNNLSIILATDGFWDCWKFLELIELIKDGSIEKLEELHIEKSNSLFGKNKDDTFLYYIR